MLSLEETKTKTKTKAKTKITNIFCSDVQQLYRYY
jgi:hypothetical protein